MGRHRVSLVSFDVFGNGLFGIFGGSFGLGVGRGRTFFASGSVLESGLLSTQLSAVGVAFTSRGICTFELSANQDWRNVYCR